MALKLNIQPEIEAEMETLLPDAEVRSKTEYINRAIAEYNQKLKRQKALAGLKTYFKNYAPDAKNILNEFENIRS